jgi:hypothetical protein
MAQGLFVPVAPGHTSTWPKPNVHVKLAKFQLNFLHVKVIGPANQKRVRGTPRCSPWTSCGRGFHGHLPWLFRNGHVEDQSNITVEGRRGG